jgi:hypothetical protein
MSIPLRSLGDLKVEEHVHSYFEAVSEVTNQAIMAQIRKIVTDFAEQQILIGSLSKGIHMSKSLGDISSAVDGLQATRR